MSAINHVGIVGAGLIGGKRAQALEPGRDQLVAVSDVSTERARTLAEKYQARVAPSAQALAEDPSITHVIVATSNDAIVPIALHALRAGKHVLVEKPAGRNPEELARLVAAAREARGALGVGFNHRFHPALLGAKEIIESGQFGPLMYIRARYGHGGRIGYDKEWRADPARGGGGELLDQGVHLIDLTRWLGGEFNLKWGDVQTFFWDMPVEDNGFLLLESPGGERKAFLHASCTEWKNLFDFEIFLRNAKVQISGLGRSYGTEELRVYKMKPEMGPPDLETTAFAGEDTSWKAEYEAFLERVAGRPSHIGTAHDALRAVEVVYGAYRQSRVSWV